MSEYEHIEWYNYWIEEADNSKNRILLIGDSVSRDLRKVMNELLNRSDYVVDLIASSFGITDKRIELELKAFFDLYDDLNWNFIVFFMGAHHGYNTDCAVESSQSIYRICLDEILGLLKQHCNTLIIAGGTLENEQLGELYLYHNQEIIRRNDILFEYSIRNNIFYIDTQKLVDEYGNEKFIDWVHYDSIYYERLALKMLRQLLPNNTFFPLNTISSIAELNRVINKNANKYIFGNSKRGQALYKYILNLGSYSNGFIVSEEYKNGEGSTIMLKDIAKVKNNCFIFVTSNDQKLYETLFKENFKYVHVHEKLFSTINEFNLIYDN